MAKLKAVRLSANPDTQVIDFKGGINGKANGTSGGAVFVTMEFEDDTNIFKFSRSNRLYYANGDKWGGATPEQMLQFVGKEVPGEFVTLPVVPYEIIGNDGKPRQVGQYTTFVMPHEDKLTVFSNAGYSVVDSDGSVLREAKVRENVSQKAVAGVKA